jgi:hypothetical protein
MHYRTAAGTRRLPSDLCRSTAIKTMVGGVTYLGATRIHEYFVADLPVVPPRLERQKIEPSARALNDGMSHDSGVTQSKTQARAIRFVSPDHRGNIDTTL